LPQWNYFEKTKILVGSTVNSKAINKINWIGIKGLKPESNKIFGWPKKR